MEGVTCKLHEGLEIHSFIYANLNWSGDLKMALEFFNTWSIVQLFSFDFQNPSQDSELCFVLLFSIVVINIHVQVNPGSIYSRTWLLTAPF